MVPAMLFAGATFFSTLAGGVVALRWPRRTELLMALAGGVVLGAALFDLLPQALSHAREAGLSPAIPWLAAACGFATFSLGERRLHHHHHGPDCETDAPGVMGVAGAAGFTVHSFFDGLAIGLGFTVDAGVGVLVALAVIGHDFSDGLTTVSYLVAHRHSLRRQRGWLLAVASSPLAGALVGSLVPVPDAVFPIALGFFSGVFVYAAATYLLPRAATLPVARALPLTLAGAGLMLAISRVA